MRNFLTLLLTGSFLFGALLPAPAQTPAAPAASTISPAAATQAWLDTVPADKKAKSDAYFEGGYWLILWNYLVSAAIALLLLASGLSARLRDFAERTTRFRPLQVAIYAVAYILLATLLSFPFDVYVGYFREHQYGLATQNFPGWLGDQAKGLIVGLILGPIALIVLYAVFRRAPRSWWIWGTGVGVVLIVISMLLEAVRKVFSVTIKMLIVRHVYI